LKVYQWASAFGDEIWDVVSGWNYFERDTIGKQVCRSADSISANIAEGYGRYFYKENKQFCYFARGSIFETKNWLKKMKTRKLIESDKYNKLDHDLMIIGKMLNKYINSIGKFPLNDH